MVVSETQMKGISKLVRLWNREIIVMRSNPAKILCHDAIWNRLSPDRFSETHKKERCKTVAAEIVKLSEE